MPASNTITASDFTVFVAGTKAQAGQVNTNLKMWRGHILPFDPNTITSIDNTYDLGASDAYWRAGYFGSLDLKGSTSTGNWTFVPNTSSTAGSIDLKMGSSTIASFSPSGFNVAGLTRPAPNMTVSANINYSTSTSVGVVTLASSIITLTSYGNPVEVSLVPTNGTNSSFQIATWINASANIAYENFLNMSLWVDDTQGTAGVDRIIQCQYLVTQLSTSATSLFLYAPVGAYRWVVYPAAGAHKYYVGYYIAASDVNLTNFKLMVREL